MPTIRDLKTKVVLIRNIETKTVKKSLKLEFEVLNLNQSFKNIHIESLEFCVHNCTREHMFEDLSLHFLL